MPVDYVFKGADRLPYLHFFPLLILLLLNHLGDLMYVQSTILLPCVGHCDVVCLHPTVRNHAIACDELT